ncbi:N-acetyltransferase [Rhizobium sp. XQZ8]|uniref:GNAT family N-acetyltransferase n=1 Tax=Rhizobium populisoli TaxID=2859785 RepID=UPI001C686212|nr:N-acetyltransferase [Rhizobium populisoli]MBW6423143.1 N-acetyltransferase [Rhizobium populisoli]
MNIRSEGPGDEDTIYELTQAAFAPMPYSSGTEGPIIRALRASGDLTLSLVAEEDGVIVGHIAFSPVSIGGMSGSWFGLGPISVRADRQKQGIGKELIREGLTRLKAMGAKGCALIGNPNVYRSSGFEADGQLSYGDLDRKYIQRIIFSGSTPKGELTYSPAFDVTH